VRFLRALAVVLALTLPAAAWAQAAGSWLTDPNSRCRFWWPDESPSGDGTYTYQSGRWTGACSNGLASGHGTFSFVVHWRLVAGDDDEMKPFTQTGEGDFVDGRLNGRGFTTYVQFNNRLRLEGEFREGLLTGRGFETRDTPKDFYRYDGDYRAGKKNGWGVMIEEGWDGTTRDRAYVSRYEGEFRNDLFEGRGVYTAGKKGCAAQMKYEGEWQAGDPRGKGTLQTVGGNTRTAVFDKELMNIKPKHTDIDKVCG
jgi:hypothetical protein